MIHNEQTLPRAPYNPPTAHPIPVSDVIRLDRMVPMDHIAQSAGLTLIKDPVAWVDAHSYWDGPLEGLVLVGGKLCLADTFMCDTTNARRSYRAFSLSPANEWWWFDHYTRRSTPQRWRYEAGAAWFARMARAERPSITPTQAIPSRDTLLGVFMDYAESIEQDEPLVLWVEALLTLISTQNPLTITNRLGGVHSDRSEGTTKNQRPPFTPITPKPPQIIRTAPLPQNAHRTPITAHVHATSTGLFVVLTRVGGSGFLEVSALREGDTLLWLHGMSNSGADLEELVIDHKTTLELAQKALIQLGA